MLRLRNMYVEQSNVEIVIINFYIRDFNKCRYSIQESINTYVDKILVEFSKLANWNKLRILHMYQHSLCLLMVVKSLHTDKV